MPFPRYSEESLNKKMPRLSVGKRSRLVALFYQFNLETSEKKYGRLVELALEEEIFIST
jgi:hypothetical protein